MGSAAWAEQIAREFAAASPQDHVRTAVEFTAVTTHFCSSETAASASHTMPKAKASTGKNVVKDEFEHVQKCRLLDAIIERIAN